MPKYSYVTGNYFFGNEISEYGQKHGYVDYATLAKAFDAVLAGSIFNSHPIDEWEVENGSEGYYRDMDGNEYTYEEAQERIEELEAEREQLDDEYIDDEENEEYTKRIEEIEQDIDSLKNDFEWNEFYQYYIISESGAEILKEWTDEYVAYNSELDLYIWGVSHCGTSWSYVLTDIKCNYTEDEE